MVVEAYATVRSESGTVRVDVPQGIVDKDDKAISDYVSGYIEGSSADDILDETGIVPEFELDEML